MKKLTPPSFKELNLLDQQIGNFIEYWGFKKIHGRVWLHLYLSDQPLDVAELMRRLKVSKTLMSFCIRDLLKYKVIEKSGRVKHGTTLYTANLDLFYVICNVLKIREKPLLANIKNAQKKCETTPENTLSHFKINSEKLKTLGKLTDIAERILDILLTLEEEKKSTKKSIIQILSLLSKLKSL